MPGCVPYAYDDSVAVRAYDTIAADRTCTPEASTVAFFGAVDTRAYMFLMTVSLLSVHRFHRQAGYFVLLPVRSNQTAGGRNWQRLLHRWSAGAVQPLVLGHKHPSPSNHFRRASGSIGNYSRMTFYRHSVPELLLTRGYTWSINLDPDVLTVRPWDLRVLLEVNLIAGRSVGRGSRTAEWLQQRLDKVASGPSKQSSSRARLQQFLHETLKTTVRGLEKTSEFNGGVLVFNNQGAAETRWFDTCVQRYEQLRHVVEGDQDLISARARAELTHSTPHLAPCITPGYTRMCVAMRSRDYFVLCAGLILAANYSLARTALPTVYNYAFRRDRERLPPADSKRLRAGIFGQTAIVSIHFVADGKPWQVQNLTGYPSWRMSARIWYVSEWHRLARSLQPPLLAVTTATELGIFGDSESFRTAQQSLRHLSGVISGSERRMCRCFLRGVVADEQKDPRTALLRKEAKHTVYLHREGLIHGGTECRGACRVANEGTAGGAAELERLSLLVLNDRMELLRRCGGSSSNTSSEAEMRQCKVQAGLERAKRPPPPNATERDIRRGDPDPLYAVFIHFLDKHQGSPAKSIYATVEQCRLAHWFSRIKSAGKAPQIQLRRQIGEEAVNALLRRVAKLPKIRRLDPNATAIAYACDHAEAWRHQKQN